MIDLSPDHLETVRRILAEQVPGCEVRAFGSRVTWTAKEFSDLDLAVVGTGALDWGTPARLREAFEESDLPMQVDVLDWHGISESFREVIGRDYEVVQQRLDEQDMKRGWSEMLFSEAVQISPNVRLTRGTIYPFVDMASVRADARSVFSSEEREFRGGGSRFRTGDTLMARITPCLENGKIARYVAEGATLEAHGSTEFFVFRGRPNVTDNDFAYYLTQWDRVRNYAISQMTGTSGRQRVPKDSLDHLIIPIPPLSEQRAIAHILGTLDDKIELNRRMNETLEKMARALFKCWFVDFEPVRAKMEGRWRRGESLPGMPAELYDVFPDGMVDSELGEIPAGWEVRALGDAIEIHDSARIPLNSRQRSERQGPIPYYGAAGIMDYVDDFLFDGIFVLTGEDGSVVDSDGYPVVQYVWGKFWVNNHAHVLRGSNGVSQEHLYLLLQQENIASFVTGAVQPKLSQKNLKSIPIVLPAKSVLQVFSDMIQPLFAALRHKSEESGTLTRSRDTLLSKLISGELRVGEIAIK